MADRPETSQEAPIPVARKLSDRAVRAVSASLKAGKSALDKPPKPAVLPRFPDARKAPGQPSVMKVEAPATSINPPPVPLPDRASAVARPTIEESAAVTTEKAPPKEAPSKVEVSPTPATPRAVPGVPASSKAIGTPFVAEVAPKGRESVDRRLDVTVGSIVGLATPEVSQERSARTEQPSAIAEVSPKVEAIRTAGLSPSVEPRVASTRPDLVAIGTSPATPGRESSPEETRPSSSAPVSVGSTFPLGRGTPSGATPLTTRPSPTVSVRGSFSTGLRNLSGTGQASASGGGSAMEMGGSGQGPVDHGFGSMASATPEGGGSVDMSKTNELLQQLVDAVRRQRDASLPVGGPPAYSGR